VGGLARQERGSAQEEQGPRGRRRRRAERGGADHHHDRSADHGNGYGCPVDEHKRDAAADGNPIGTVGHDDDITLLVIRAS